MVERFVVLNGRWFGCGGRVRSDCGGRVVVVGWARGGGRVGTWWLSGQGDGQ